MILPDSSTVNCPLVFACDADYAMPLATTIRSIVESNRRGWPLSIYVLSHGFYDNLKTKIIDSLPSGSCSVRWAPVDLSIFAGFSTLRHISSATYARLLLPSILPEGIPKALYLDADVLVLDDLSPIWETNLGGAVLAAVLDERLNKHIKLGNTSLAGLPLPRVREYFNAGVLLIDLARWQEERISEKALGYLERYPNTVYSDQDALNVACDGMWKQLDARWNCYQIDLEKPISNLYATQRPGIVHFHGPLKPWKPAALNVNAEFYDGFRRRTLFASTLVERVSHVPIVLWSRLRNFLKQSATARYVWKRLQLHGAHDPAKRLST